MNVRYRVTLTQYERNELRALLSGGKSPARKLKRVQILLAANAGVSDEDIAFECRGRLLDRLLFRVSLRESQSWPRHILKNLIS